MRSIVTDNASIVTYNAMEAAGPQASRIVHRLRQALSAAVAATAVAAGAALAVHHPLWPEAVLAAFLACCLLSACRPDVGPLIATAGLPVFDLSPWSGWLAFQEFDLLVLGAIAGGHFRLATRFTASRAANGYALPPILKIAATVFVVASATALWRGSGDSGGLAFGASQAGPDPMSSLRVFKPLLLIVLLFPVIRAEFDASPDRTMQRVGAGMAIGLALVTIAVMWERIAYAGLIDFSKPYRAVGLFWEMRVGGGAIDAYLAMTAPFAVWVLRSARTPGRWAFAAAFCLLVTYACLTTFSRGVYLAVGLPVIFLLAAAAPPQQSFLRWRRRAGRFLVAIVVLEIVAVSWTGSFLLERMANSDRDLRGRVIHWARGLGLMHDPSDRAFGIGLGRLPSHFSRFVAGYEFSGAVASAPATGGRRAVRLFGPPTRDDLGGLYSLTQRVPLRDGARYRVELEHRVEARTALVLRVCELHLLYERGCQSRAVVIAPGASPWQRLALDLEGPALERGAAFAPRLAAFELSILNVAGHADVARVRLHADASPDLIRNGDFAEGLAHWLPSAQGWFTPWHIDNLYLELLVERGPLALAAFIIVVAWTLRRLIASPIGSHPFAPFLVASLLGALLIGAVSSFMDAPRPAFLMFFLIAFSMLLVESRSATARV